MGSQKRQPGFLIAQMIAPVRHFVAPVRKETDLRTDCPDCLSDPQGVCDECAFANDVIGVGSGAGIPWPMTPAMCRPTEEEEEENNDRD